MRYKMRNTGALNTVIFALIAVPLMIAMISGVFYWLTNYTASFSTIPELHASLIAWAMPNLLVTCNTTLQQCTSMNSKKIAQSASQLLISSKKIGIHFELPVIFCPSPIGCQYNSDFKKDPDCATRYSNGWCAYQQLATTRANKKQIILLTPEQTTLLIHIRTEP